MINSADLDSLIEELDLHLYHYSSEFIKEKIDFDALTGNESFLTNERTIASAANLLIAIILNSIGYKPYLSVNEFPIKIYGFSKSKGFDRLRKEVGDPDVRTEVWKKAYVDGYFKVPNLLSTDVINHIFVEYKMNNSFVFLDLANDFLKYKAYTYKNEKDTIFVYAIFDKKENYPSILNKTKPHYELIGPTISKSSLSSDSKIFIYKGEPTKKDVSNIDEAINKISGLIDKANEINEMKEKGDVKKVSDNDIFFVNHMRDFNSRVIKSYTIRNHYSFIKEVWDKSNEMGLFNDLSIIFDTEEDPNKEAIIKEGSQYQNNLSSTLTLDDKIAANGKGIRGSTNVSLFILSLIDYFNEYYKVGVSSPNYGSKTFGRGKNKRQFEWKTTVETFKESLKERWSAPNYNYNNFKKLVYSLMYYITNLYGIIFDIEDNVVIDYKEGFKMYKLIDELQDSLPRVMKWFKYKPTHDINIDNLVSESKESLDELLSFSNHIIKNY